MNLRLLQIADSALPIGGYTHSWGLEAAIARGRVRDAETLETWVRGWLRFALGPMEGAVVGAACRAVLAKRWEALHDANEMLEVGLIAPSLRMASGEMGEQLLALAGTWEWSAAGAAEALANIEGSSGNRAVGSSWHHAVVFGLLGALSGARPRDTVTVYLHQAALGTIVAGVRAVPVGHTHGQQILAYLHDEIQELGGKLVDRDLAEVGSSCPIYEVYCDEQSRLYARVFRS